ncbi:kinetochore protein Spc25 isoform X1 [Callorhinchus milii]|uniref:Kinetochore protein SPC25 n=1 Tax=Callorhinchus milii TaxID=7868 RepID=K4FXZ1_CALMI|nr:kinetochore protein Spc25 [Callorhinchus milii]XP_007888061.1 kinetochore protein Spc25 isoform X1 [Callorhinchus milii]XP_007888063.1 kinetochore protein Spc25 isoform X1 [Callorhinchus milii]AFK10772.1 kinetochore protein Spc25-like protein [Callorhinchus milii]|eukprot:gi/632945433/ref/XP_007888061.1/ PREDICTED: kinetochore protein Spc25 [Callorhinchus milii]
MGSVKEDATQLKEKLNETRIKFFTLWESDYNSAGFKQQYRESLKITTDKCLQKYEEEKVMCAKIQQTSKAISEHNILITKRYADLKNAHSDFKSSVQQKGELLEKIKELKEGIVKKQGLLLVQKQENKARLKELNKAADLFKKRMGLEIRKVQGEQLQFIFRYINHKNPEQPFTFLLKINDEGNYQVLSCDPPLECMTVLQERLRQSNNFSAFLANIRKAFTALI